MTDKMPNNHFSDKESLQKQKDFDQIVCIPYWLLDALTSWSIVHHNHECTQNRSFIPFEQSFFTPTLDLKALKLFLFILASLQESLFENISYSCTITLDLSFLKEKYQIKTKDAFNLWQKTLGMLWDLRLHHFSEGSSRSIRFFEETCFFEKEGQEFLKMTLYPQTKELLFGFSCYFQEKIRQSEQKNFFEKSFKRKNPLCLQKSMWLDLRPEELMLLHTLEQKSSSISAGEAENIFFISYEDVFSAFNFFRKKKLSFVHTKRQLQQTFKKLLYHGYFSFLSQDLFDQISYKETEKKDGFFYLLSKSQKENLFISCEKEFCFLGLRQILSSNISLSEALATSSLISIEDFLKIKEVIFTLPYKKIKNTLLAKNGFPVSAVALMLEHYFLIKEKKISSLNHIFFQTLETKTLEHFLKEFPVLLEEFIRIHSSKTEASIFTKAPLLPDILKEPTQTVAPSIQSSKLQKEKSKVSLKPFDLKRLENLKQDDPSQFEKIKEKCFSLLSEKEKKVLLDLKSRVSKDFFDKQLDSRILSLLSHDPSALL